MRILSTIVFALMIAAATAVLAQPPKGKAPDDPPPPADRPRLDPPPPGDGPRPRREPRPDEDSRPNLRPKADSPGHSQPVPMPVPGMPGAGPFGPGMRGAGPAMQGGYGEGGFGGRGHGAFGGAFPRPAGPFGEPPPDDPEMRDLMKQDAELEQQSHQMAQRVRETSGDDKQRIRDSLADVVAKHFDVRQKRRELQIKRMEEELKRLREEIAKRNDSRKAITDNRFRELTGESRDLDF